MYYKVIEGWNDSFYSGMIGKLILENPKTYPKTYLLEFMLSDEFGGTHRVMFLSHQVMEYQANLEERVT